ncbi:MAG: TRAP-type C4-dicarboxylate transport system, small permease component [Deltaproteobacteria bacterium]|jgi:TRAP-type C4-dicarboxylate transport system permease small subunit|nr:TRAP-type C4-dicarboxylate transport system, small permease component [Deltaproteobacteria bacterium]
MKRFLTTVFKVDVAFQIISGLVLAVMMVVTLLDVIMRNFGRPIVGSIEIISFLGSVVIGFAIPYASWKRAHVYVDFVVEKLSPRRRFILNVITRFMGIALFAFVGYNFIMYGLDLRRTHEVSPAFRLPYYPIPFGLSLSCFLQSLTLVADLVKITDEDRNR